MPKRGVNQCRSDDDSGFGFVEDSRNQMLRQRQVQALFRSTRCLLLRPQSSQVTSRHQSKAYTGIRVP